MKDYDAQLRYAFERDLRNLRNRYENFVREADRIINSYSYQISYGIAREGYSVVTLPLISISICRDPRSTSILDGDFILRIEFLHSFPGNIVNAFMVMDSFAKDSYPKITSNGKYIIFFRRPWFENGNPHRWVKTFQPKTHCNVRQTLRRVYRLQTCS